MEQMTVKQVAQALGVSRDTIRRWVAGGRLKAYAVLGKGRTFYFDRADVERLKRQRAVPLAVALKSAERRDKRCRKNA